MAIVKQNIKITMIIVLSVFTLNLSMNALIHPYLCLNIAKLVMTIEDWLYHIPWKFWGRKVSWQVVQADFRKKLLWNPPYFLLNPYLNSTILNFYIKSFVDMQKVQKRQNFFCLETFMIHSTIYVENRP